MNCNKMFCVFNFNNSCNVQSEKMNKEITPDTESCIHFKLDEISLAKFNYMKKHNLSCLSGNTTII